MAIWSKIFSTAHTENVKRFEPLVAKINELEPGIRALSDAELEAKTAEFKEKIGVKRIRQPAEKGGNASQESLDDILPEAFAVVREAARRTLGQRHFDVQLMGGMVLNSGAIAEMKTGEGKTLVATLSAYMNALSGKGVHIVTVNDYLSRRDAVWMGQIYFALGLSVAVINHESSFLYDPKHRQTGVGKENEGPFGGREGGRERGVAPAGDNAVSRGSFANPVGDDSLDQKRDETGSFHVVHEFLRPVSRREAYAADITYGTNVEFGFDYLRDNLEYNPNNLRQRDFNYVIVDEIDSILIDEARTPLIISAPMRDAESTYKQFASMAAGFTEGEDYEKDEKHRSISLLSAGITKAEKALGIENLYTDAGIKSVHHLETAVRAKALYHKDKEYVVKGDEVIIVDEFTGRLQPGRRWSEGLHQAIEAKEGVKIQQESRTYATVTYQNFFRMYPKLSGMTGTAATSSEEFFKVYGLEVYTVPTNVPVVRKDSNDQIFRTEVGKFKAIARKIKALHDSGQPVLVGTVSIEKNEVLSRFLKAEGIPHTLLNAKPEYAEKEGEIVAQAGAKSAVTIATNMAGRGVDVKLGGNPNTPESYQEVKGQGGLFVLGTERHEARRIDNQLRGRSGRQGDPGETQFFVSLEDQLMRVFASDMLKGLMGKLNVPEDEPIEHRMISRALESAQEKIEGFNFDSRKHVLEFDDVINTQRSAIYGRRRKLLLGNADDVENELWAIIKSADAKKGGSQELAKLGLKSGPVRPGNGAVSAPEDDPTDAIKAVLAKKIAEFGRDRFLQAVRILLLQTIDMFWVEHLEVMDYTRGSVNLRAYGQRDPLVEYKKEGLRLFKEMQAAMRGQVARILPNIIPVEAAQENAKAAAPKGVTADLQEIKENAQTIGKGSDSKNLTFGAAVSPGSGDFGGKKEPGRNDPCWCGSGKKYKKCHGVNR